MRAVVKTAAGPGGLELREVDEPVARAGEILVASRGSGICGTDLVIEDWPEWIAPRVDPPITLGHEGFGVVDAVGEGVERIKVGDRVGIESHVFCGHCRNCLSGMAHICERLRYVGMQIPGFLADQAVVPASLAFTLPEELADRVAVLMEPLGLAVRAASEGDGVSGRTVLITGCGPLGAMTAIVSRALGAELTIASEVSPGRLALLREKQDVFGIDHLIDAGKEDVVEAVLQTTGDGVDLWIDFVGSEQTLNQGLEATRAGGEAHLFAGAGRTGVDMTKPVLKELRSTGIHGRRIYDTWVSTVRLGIERAEQLEAVITDVLPLESHAEAFALARGGEGMKVVLTPTGELGE